VSSYFKNSKKDIKTEYLIAKADKIEWIITNNEVEALILENNLIKKHKPKFNIRLVDDKTYPYIKININSEYPAVKVTRRKSEDGSLYFGPYTSAIKLKQVLNFINKNFNLRKCSDNKFGNRKKPCLNYQIKICSAPCCGKISPTDYANNIKRTIMFLEGKTSELIEEIKQKMAVASKNTEYEKAIYYRDLMRSIELLFENQIMEKNDLYDKDLFHTEFYNNKHYFIVLKIKKGKVIHHDFFVLKETAILNGAVTEEFLPKYYSLHRNIPDKIVVNEEINFALIKDFISKKFSKKVEIFKPKTENDKNLLNFAKENISERLRLINLKNSVPELLKNKLKLKRIPARIDAFDISTFSGKSSVGTRVSFVNLIPEKKLYRKYNIKRIEENELNDFAMIEEIVERSCKEYASNNEKPDIILIDGGKGQLNAAVKALKRYNFSDKIHIIAIAKNRDEKYDKIFVPNRKNPVNISKTPLLINFLMKIRDEVHRFSITFHRKKESEKILATQLTEINGIGEKKAKQLLLRFKSIENIKKAPLQELLDLPFLSKSTAQNVYNFFNS
jgi:excinuclease ABC subunit C